MKPEQDVRCLESARLRSGCRRVFRPAGLRAALASSPSAYRRTIGHSRPPSPLQPIGNGTRHRLPKGWPENPVTNWLRRVTIASKLLLAPPAVSPVERTTSSTQPINGRPEPRRLLGGRTDATGRSRRGRPVAGG